ncbi:hypothetical protein [Streptomyces viridochromogenes]|uniref:hypothetical protein n=1 Tax=Streptomyces viridochromogenes TaxID=1938 RepID=UPI00131A292C|nr:hypothetical protein [Streptomyces viridochromogenes]
MSWPTPTAAAGGVVRGAVLLGRLGGVGGAGAQSGVLRGRRSLRGPLASPAAGTLFLWVVGLIIGVCGAGASYGVESPPGTGSTGAPTGSTTTPTASTAPLDPPLSTQAAVPSTEPGTDTEGSAGAVAESHPPSTSATTSAAPSASSAASEEPKASPASTAHGPAASSPSPSGRPSRAGSKAGEGRERPGRGKPPREDEEAAQKRPDGGEDAEEGDGSGLPEEEAAGEDDDGGGAYESPDASADPTQDASAVPGRPVRQPAAHGEGPAEPVLQVLPLGTGLVLVGLGLGLAFLGLRLRRG